MGSFFVLSRENALGVTSLLGANGLVARAASVNFFSNFQIVAGKVGQVTLEGVFGRQRPEVAHWTACI